jgi:GH15 family glucan-1,4-alpha-glucosidase
VTAGRERTAPIADHALLSDGSDELDGSLMLIPRVASLRKDVGPLAEEWDPAAGRQLGDFSQALSHLAMVESAARLATGGST